MAKNSLLLIVFTLIILSLTQEGRCQGGPEITLPLKIRFEEASLAEQKEVLIPWSEYQAKAGKMKDGIPYYDFDQFLDTNTPIPELFAADDADESTRKTIASHNQFIKKLNALTTKEERAAFLSKNESLQQRYIQLMKDQGYNKILVYLPIKPGYFDMVTGKFMKAVVEDMSGHVFSSPADPAREIYDIALVEHFLKQGKEEISSVGINPYAIGAGKPVINLHRHTEDAQDYGFQQDFVATAGGRSEESIIAGIANETHQELRLDLRSISGMQITHVEAQDTGKGKFATIAYLQLPQVAFKKHKIKEQQVDHSVTVVEDFAIKMKTFLDPTAALYAGCPRPLEFTPLDHVYSAKMGDGKESFIDTCQLDSRIGSKVNELDQQITALEGVLSDVTLSAQDKEKKQKELVKLKEARSNLVKGRFSCVSKPEMRDRYLGLSRRYHTDSFDPIPGVLDERYEGQDVVDVFIDMDDTLASYNDFENSDAYYPIVEAAFSAEFPKEPGNQEKIDKANKTLKDKLAAFNSEYGADLKEDVIRTNVQEANTAREQSLAQMDPKVQSWHQSKPKSDLWYYKTTENRRHAGISLIESAKNKLKAKLEELRRSKKPKYILHILTSRGKKDQTVMTQRQLHDMGIHQYFEGRIHLKSDHKKSKADMAKEIVEAQGRKNVVLIDNDPRHLDSFDKYDNDPSLNVFRIQFHPPRHAGAPNPGDQDAWREKFSSATISRIISPKRNDSDLQ